MLSVIPQKELFPFLKLRNASKGPVTNGTVLLGYILAEGWIFVHAAVSRPPPGFTKP
jgi:hypothetical protein